MKPDYYTKGGLECFDAIKAATEGLTGYEGFLTGNIVKYAWRWNDKGGVADLEKAAEYARKLMELTEGTTDTATEPRPYTLDELKALPEGARVWEERPGHKFWESMWHTKCDNLLTDEDGKYHLVDCMSGEPWRVWPTEPTPERSAAWPWGNGGGK